ncbi:hypothetical protein D9M72_444010 [compost metagenome]
MRTLLHSVINDHIVGDASKLVTKIVIDGLMCIDSFNPDAGLPGVQECATENCRGDLFRISVRENNSRVVTAELKRKALDRRCCGSHDFFARLRRTSETDLCNIGMRSHGDPEIIQIGNNIDHSCRKKVAN